MPSLRSEIRRIRGPVQRPEEYWDRRKAESADVLDFFRKKGLA